jgi:hypothetical protein
MCAHVHAHTVTRSWYEIRMKYIVLIGGGWCELWLWIHGQGVRPHGVLLLQMLLLCFIAAAASLLHVL